jgi:putative ABC transport system permease protein
MFNEVTEANVDSFHFHGDEGGFPVQAILVQPHDTKSEALLVGRFQKDKAIQIIRPVDVLEVLLAALFRVEKLVVAALALVAGAAIVVAILVFGLSFRLRKREFDTLAEVGVSRATLLMAQVAEIAIVGALALGVAAAGPWIAAAMAHAVVLKSLG